MVEAGNQLSREEATTMALVVQDKSQAIDGWLRDRGTEKSTRKAKIVDAEAYHRGYEDGGNISLAVKRTMK